ncbi:hypothetical protein [Arenicella xantha]|uniref:Uncharacterized protein n=1 Tax=Arenicella xantha TaxID=644221 RepID=A0A395JMI7_9GAMM|nr:hypothetical protein [Arenicella xantha]RBP52864.1 hypothetical protein DFR28_101248 [Arenicella xantha]
MKTTADVKDKYQSLISTLKRERDELNVKVHLASMEVRDEWKGVEEKWEHLQSKGRQLGQATDESAHELGDAVSILGSELKETYKRLKRAL